MNKKGFTMVELLVAMSIMGLLIIMAFPTMRAVQTNNQKKNYQSYGDAIVSAAKLYTDSYAEDLFRPDTRNETKSLPVSELLKKGLIKNKGISGVDCVTESTVTIVKYNTDYAYCLNLKCTTGGTTVYEEKNRKGSCSEFKEAKVIYKYNGSYKEINIVAGEEYKILRPDNLKFDFAANKDVFIDWKQEGTDKHYNPGDIINIPLPTSDTDIPTITLAAHTRKYKYNVIYDKGVGTGTMPKKTPPCELGKQCKLDKNKFTKTGYHFTVWKYDASNSYNDEQDLNGVVNNLITKDNQDFKLTAQFAINQCTVTYAPNGGVFGAHSSATDRVEKVNYGSYFGDATNGMRNANGGHYSATRTGYHIDAATAWISGSKTFDETKRYLAQDVCDLSKGSNSATLNVNWKINQCTVTYSPNGGTFGANSTSTKQTVNYGSYFGDNPTVDGMRNANGGHYSATRTGYHADPATAWISGSKTFDERKSYLAQDVCDLSKGNNSATLNVNWKINQCTVTYSPNGGTFNAHANDTVQTVSYNGYFGDATDGMRNANGGHYSATRTGYYINAATAWTTGSKTFDETKRYLSQNVCDLSKGSNSATLKVNWIIRSFTLRYENSDNSGSCKNKTITKTYGSQWGTLCTPAHKKGYTFEGWYSGSTKITASSVATSNLNVTAKWRTNNIIIHYHTNGGTIKPGTKQKCPKSAGTKAKDHMKKGSWVSHASTHGSGCKESSNCTGKKSGEVLVEKTAYSATAHGIDTAGLRDHSNEETSTLYMKKEGKDATIYWHIGSASGKKISSKDTYANSVKLAEALGVKTQLENGDVTVHLYADWK